MGNDRSPSRLVSVLVAGKYCTPDLLVCENLSTFSRGEGFKSSAPSFYPVLSPSQTSNFQLLRRGDHEYDPKLRAFRM